MNLLPGEAKHVYHNLVRIATSSHETKHFLYIVLWMVAGVVGYRIMLW